jgi:8-oxo-dGTP pyrophosphatase MutT (NUDIX family)
LANVTGGVSGRRAPTLSARLADAPHRPARPFAWIVSPDEKQNWFNMGEIGSSIPRDVMFAVDEVRVRLDPAPHPYELANTQDIERNWQQERERNPALFDGTTVLMSELFYAAGRLEGVCHAVRFATLMHWRRARPAESAEHVFAHAMLVASDNALVAVRMGGHTANAGRVYFAAGSFEPEDFPGGMVDVHHNMAREVLEETGIDLAGRTADAAYHACSTNGGTVLVRRFHLDESADTVAAQIRDFVVRDPEPEIEGPVLIRGPNDVPENLSPHMRPLIAWHFGEG